MQGVLQSRFVRNYGNLFVLILLCGYYSWATLDEFHPADRTAGRQLGRFVADGFPDARVLIVTPSGEQNAQFADAIRSSLEAAGISVEGVVQGGPRDANSELRRLGESGTEIDFVATQFAAARWPVLQDRDLQRLATEYPSLRNLQVIKPSSYQWPTFLKADNIRSIVNNIAIIAIIAIGMTMVIVTAGIDLSVGSLIALSGIICAKCVQELAGAGEASTSDLVLSVALAIAACGAFGLFTGVMVTRFGVPSFIVTLAVMQIARGAAYKVAKGPSPISIDSEEFQWLGGGDVWGVPNPVILMLGLYCGAHVLMSQTALGRYIYAVGGNPEAARLSGVPVKRVLIFAYLVCGALSGLAGVIDASLFQVGRPVAGMGYELQIIAAVVVGGTSLAGGEGRIFGTLIGALILSVIQNGMQLTKVDTYTQMVVFGGLILAAVLLDQLKTARLKKG